MIVLAVLVISWLLLRAAGALGISALASWRAASRAAIAIMLLFTGAAHFTPANLSPIRADMVRMVPDWMPYPEAAVFLTGVFEIAGAIGILLPPTRALAGLCLCILFVAMFPANVKVAVEGLTIAGTPATPLVWRLPLQILLIGLTWWSTRANSTPALPSTRNTPRDFAA